VNEGQKPVDWCALVSHFLHPTKVLIIEAMTWIGRPMSAIELTRVLDETVDLSGVSYHVRCLRDVGVLQQAGKRPVRGTSEKFYDFAAAA
jgi:hypothetical protein